MTTWLTHRLESLAVKAGTNVTFYEPERRHRGAVQDFSRGLSEHSERYPRSTSTASFLARLRRAGIREISFTGGCALRAYLRLKSSTAPRCRPQKTLRHWALARVQASMNAG